MRDYAGATFPVLADPAHDAASAYGVFNLLDDGVAAPATFVISGGQLVASHVGQAIGERVSAPAILDVLRQLRGEAPTTAS